MTVAPPDASEAAIAAAPATELFVARASARDPTFRLEEHAAGVAAVCDRTAGLPLAIELAAARIGMLTPAQIAERMTAGGLDLTLDLRDTPERHRSLRATLDWSYDLLSPAQRDAFEPFAVFVGDAAPEIAEHVADVPTDRLEALVSQGLLVRRPGTQSRARLAMLEPIRDFAAERLQGRDDHAAIRHRHARQFVTLAESGRIGLFGRDWATWRDRLADDVANFRAALQWTIERQDREVALRIAIALRKFWDLRWLTLEGFPVA